MVLARRQPAPAPAQRSAPVRSRRSRARVAAAKPSPSAYIAKIESSDRPLHPMHPDYAASLGEVRALVAKERKVAPRDRSLASARGYRRADLMVVADIAYNYLMNGAHRLAQTLFEGLRSVDPAEPYFALALGLTYDRLGDVERAKVSYTAAARLDPQDGRPFVNLAEFALVDGDRASARRLLEQGLRRAEAGADEALVRKARALAEHIKR